jgi:MFS superfamily sulfate permease-like transporter
MHQGLTLAIPAAALTLVLLGQSRLPAMLLLLVYGGAAAIFLEASLLGDLAAVKPGFRMPSVGLPSLGWGDLVAGTLGLALPQAALTLGNAVIATAEEHNALFPHRPVSVRLLALDHGIMNLVAVVLGGVPMCRGAGGMAGHVRFGARTGGALIILGAGLLTIALFFPGSVTTLFRLFPLPVLGVILLFAGLELATSATNGDASSRDRTVVAITAGLALWNMGAAYLTGLLVYHAAERRLVRL